MPRIRTIKPDSAKHEGLFDAEVETGLPIRFVWAFLPCFCDREGRFQWRTRRLSAEILPYDEKADMARVLDALLTRGFIAKYRVGQAWYGFIPTFTKHQVVNNRESDSEIPAISEGEEVIYKGNHDLPGARPTREARDKGASSTREVHALAEGKGREGKGENNTSGKPDPCETVFKHWQEVMGHARAKFDKKRKGKVKDRLADGYTAEDLMQAIDGCKRSPHHMGDNDHGTVYDGLELICRDAEHVDRFIAIAEGRGLKGKGQAEPNPPSRNYIEPQGGPA